jgi:hypothetical protein
MISLQEKLKRNLYTVAISGYDGHNPFDGTLYGEFMFFKDGYNTLDDIMEEDFEYIKYDRDA